MTQGDPQAAAGVREGQILAGKYRIERVLSVGGMGVVVAATHLQLDTRVALKFLLPATLSNPDAVARFAAEAQRNVKIRSEHVARVLDVGELDNGAPYMVMELLEGSDLSTWLRERGRLPVSQAVDFVLQACVAVADAHGLGIIHRDLKPSNLFCVKRSDGQLSVKVLDFGISKLTEANRGSDPASMSTTKTAAVLGSPLYMSPEQVQNAKDVDVRTDIWALGVILFQLLTDSVPFPGDAFGEVAIRIAMREPPSIRALRPEVPVGLEAVVFECLEKDRQRRYSNVGELAQALLPFGPEGAKALVGRITGILQAAGLSASAAPAPNSPPSASREGTVLEPSVPPWSGTMAGRKSKAVLVWSLVGMGVLGAAAVVLALRSWPGTKPSDPGQDHAPSILADAHVDPDACVPNATRCDGVKFRRCDNGKWPAGSIVAGECGAACSPEGSPRCSGDVPQVCDATGQWVDGPSCKVCSDGACVTCSPGTRQCTHVGWMQTCGSDGQWQTAVPPSKGSACHDGFWIASIATPAPKHCDCDPNYTIDPKSGAHLFKPQCFTPECVPKK